MSTRTTQIRMGEQAPPVYTDLGYGGDANGLAFWFAPHPTTGANVTLVYDRQTSGTTSKPPCLALEALARFATLVRDAGEALRRERFTDRQLAGLLETSELLARACPRDERWLADLEAVRIEVRRRGSLGPAIAEAQRTGGDVRGLVARDLFSDGC